MLDLAAVRVRQSGGVDASPAPTAAPVGDSSLKQAFDRAPIGQVVCGLDGVVTSANDRLASMLGYRPEEMIGRPVQDFVPDGFRSEVRATAQSLLEDDAESAGMGTRRVLHRDGHDVAVSVTAVVVRDDYGQPVGWLSLVLDLSDAERARTDLEAAHVAALAAAERVRLWQEVATVANKADTVEELAPSVLGLVCTHLGWVAGCLVREQPSDDSDEPRLDVVGHLGDHASLVEVFRTVRAGDRTDVTPASGPAGQVIVVPLGSTGPKCFTWLFAGRPGDLSDENVEVLKLVGIETSRVVEREAAAAQLRDSETRFRSVFGGSPLPMGLTLGNSGTYAAVNDALCDLLGYPPEQVIGQSATRFCHPDDVALADPAGAAAAADPNGRHKFEMRLLHSAGDVVITQVTLAWIARGDSEPQLLAQIEDITGRRMIEEILQRQASHDSLTGLANRTQLNRTLVGLAKTRSAGVVLFVDIDGFKLINDTRGHDVGDEVLVDIAARLRRAVRPQDLVARFGGDEFVIVCVPDGRTESPSLATSIADRIERAFELPVQTSSGPAEISASIGIAEGIINSHHPQRLVQRADAAMYMAKKLGKDRRAVYDVALHRRSLDQVRTEAALRTALEDDRFIVHFQPIVDLADHSVQGFEALVRLVDRRGKLVSPADFISVAEQSGLIVPMGTWMLRNSCQTLARLRQQFGLPLTMSVNVAARQAARDDLSEIVLSALADSGLPKDSLSLELTESALLEATSRTLDQLNALREHGVKIALDDFGTGYSSLTYLQQLPVTHLKIDRSFVADMVAKPGAKAIVRSVALLAQELDLTWIAEGIETEAQLRALTEIGPGYGQGYLFSRPVPADRLPELLAPRLDPYLPGQRAVVG